MQKLYIKGSNIIPPTELVNLGYTYTLLNQKGQTIVMVKHEPEYARLADWNIELLDGKITKDKMLR